MKNFESRNPFFRLPRDDARELALAFRVLHIAGHADEQLFAALRFADLLGNRRLGYLSAYLEGSTFALDLDHGLEGATLSALQDQANAYLEIVENKR